MPASKPGSAQEVQDGLRVDPADLPDPNDDEFYARYLETCRAAGIEPNSRERVERHAARCCGQLRERAHNEALTGEAR